jgi:hypothetical protein
VAQQEREIINERLKNLKPNERLFRINCGMGWIGETVKHTDNMIILKNPRPLHAAPEGWGDLAGWTENKIAAPCCGSCDKLQIPDVPIMCGYWHDAGRKYDYVCWQYEPRNPQSIAIFTMEEFKIGKLKLSPKQKLFQAIIERMGGIFRVIREV